MMKFLNILMIVTVAALFVACANDKAPSSNAVTPTTPAPMSASVVQHYICPNNCQGSGGDMQGTCPACGSEYLHNDAFHANDAPATDPSVSTMKGPQAQPGAQQPGATTATPQMPQAPAPAQNAAGVYHYACSKSGCGGGAGAAGSCPKCGSALAHNQAYHQ